MGIKRLGPPMAAIVAVLALVACGSSSSSSSASAPSLLKQTFSSGHSVKSGVLGFTLTLKPTGSSTLSTPITLSLGGPFQSRGSGKLPQSDFTIGISALGRHGSLGVISTGTAGYVSLQGTNYQLPQADFQKLQQSFSSAQSSGGSQDAGLAQLGIDPEHWLTHPVVVGTETVNGASTTHIRAGVDVTALISDLNSFLAKTAKSTNAASSGVPTQIPPATQQKIAAAVQNATVDVWTGKNDSTLRKLTLSLTVPVTGQISTSLGGMTSAGIVLTIQYAKLNQPQSVATPTEVHPYSEFTAKLQTIGQQLTSALGGSLGSGATSSASGTATVPSSGSGSAAGVSKYSACIQKANGDVTKMQKCASLLNGG
jgi:hypothetical protein